MEQQQPEQAGQQTRGMQVITISRQYGSGGGEVAARLAQRLGWQLIDHEIVAQVAHRMGVTEEEAGIYDEHVESFVVRALNALQSVVPVVPVAPTTTTQQEGWYHETLRHVVETAAQTGHVVIVGRAGQAFLASRRDTLHARIVAPLPQRITYVARREGLDEAEAQARVQMKDRDRARYLSMHFGLNVNDALLYDLIINTGVLDLDSAVELICLALERKASRLRITTRELGPAAGMQPYPGRPADIRPLTSTIEKENT